MAEMDYSAANLSLISPPSVNNDDVGLGIPPWEAMSISQVLLPVLCALFIAAVIVVIACCLIQKKSKSPGVIRQKSCHTIETLHEVSDHDIYDVIQEIRCKNASPDKYHRRHDKMDTIRSHKLAHSDLTNLFANKSSALSLHVASKFDLLTSKMAVRNSRDWVLSSRGSVDNDARLSTNTDGGVSNFSNDDEGIYETLDRNWTFKNEQLDNAPSQTVVQKLIAPQQIERCLDSVPDSNSLDVAKLPNGSKNCNNTDNARQTLSSTHTKESRRLLCQINMFEVTNEKNNPTLIETSYFQVHPQISIVQENTVTNVSGVLQNSSLRIVPDDSARETSPNPDLFLQALKEEDLLRHNLPDPLICKTSSLDIRNNQGHDPSVCQKLEKVTKTYEKLHRSNSKRFPLLTMKKSESFRTQSSESYIAKEQRRLHRRKSDSSDMDNPLAPARSLTRHANICPGPEATRILTKLGPLPPVPGQSQNSQQKETPKYDQVKLSWDTSNNDVIDSEKCESTSTTFLKDIQKLPPSLDSDKALLTLGQTKADILSSLPFTEAVICGSNKQNKSNNANISSSSRSLRDESLIMSLSVISHDNITSDNESNTDSDITSTGSACAASTDNVCDNIVALNRGEDEVSNYYFILEPRDGISSSNSDINRISDCEDQGATDSIDTHSSSSSVPPCDVADHISQDQPV